MGDIGAKSKSPQMALMKHLLWHRAFILRKFWSCHLRSMQLTGGKWLHSSWDLGTVPLTILISVIIILGGPRSFLSLDRKESLRHGKKKLSFWVGDKKESGKLELNLSLMQEFVLESVWAQWGPEGLPAPAVLSLIVCLMYRWCLSSELWDAPSGSCADFQLICWLKQERCKSVLVNV